MHIIKKLPAKKYNKNVIRKSYVNFLFDFAAVFLLLLLLLFFFFF